MVTFLLYLLHWRRDISMVAVSFTCSALKKGIDKVCSFLYTLSPILTITLEGESRSPFGDKIPEFQRD